MTKLLDEAVDKVRRLPESRQDEAARILLAVVEQDASDAPRLTDDQVAEVRRRQADPRYASDEDVAAFFARTGG